MKVELELTEKQLQTIIHALDQYVRLGLGQAEKLDWPEYAGDPLDNDEKDKILNKFKRELLGYSLNGSMGIGNPNVSLPAKCAYEMGKLLEGEFMRYKNSLNPKPDYRMLGLPLELSGEPFVKVAIFE